MKRLCHRRIGHRGYTARQPILAYDTCDVDDMLDTLAGVVSNKTDRDMAALRANGVSGVFSVNNSLKVEQGS